MAFLSATAPVASSSSAPRLTGGNRPELDIPDFAFDLVRGRSEWQKIWDRVQGDLVACMPFGRYKIVEMTMATHYRVSRTVTAICSPDSRSWV